MRPCMVTAWREITSKGYTAPSTSTGQARHRPPSRTAKHEHHPRHSLRWLRHPPVAAESPEFPQAVRAPGEQPEPAATDAGAPRLVRQRTRVRGLGRPPFSGGRCHGITRLSGSGAAGARRAQHGRRHGARRAVGHQPGGRRPAAAVLSVRPPHPRHRSFRRHHPPGRAGGRGRRHRHVWRGAQLPEHGLRLHRTRRRTR
jgi:hypothetical protein